MTRAATLRDRLSKDEWRYAFAGGLLSIPLTVMFSEFGQHSHYSAIGFVAAGLVAGLLYRTGPAGGALVGSRAALVGSIPVVPVFVETLLVGNAGTLFSSGFLWGVASVLFTIFELGIFVGICVLVGMVSGHIGGRLREVLAGPRRQPTAC